jgi:GTP-binding protein
MGGILPRITKVSRFVDSLIIRLEGGAGGDGGIAFARGRTVFGKADGGNGGKGGKVSIKAGPLTCLEGLERTYRAENGTPGGRNNQHGKDGKDIIINVPIGTTITEITPEVEQVEEITIEQKVYKYFKFGHKYTPQLDRFEMLSERIPAARQLAIINNIDLLHNDQSLLICPGGNGGFGNPHYVSPAIPGPRIASKGEPRTVRIIKLDLKTIADVGLIGLPNAGKSTLLNAITNAHPKIAPYPFTTLTPYVGVVNFSDSYRFTIADLPGIIKNAHLNRGLGHEFLKHIERTSVLIYVIDVSSKEPWLDLQTVQEELEKYKVGLSKRPGIICANKADLKGAELNLEELAKRTDMVIVPVSAKYEKNLEYLVDLMRVQVKDCKLKLLVS